MTVLRLIKPCRHPEVVRFYIYDSTDGGMTTVCGWCHEDITA